MSFTLCKQQPSASHANLVELLETRRPGYSLEQPLYNSDQAFALDMDFVFMREWLFVGVSADVPEVGDYITFNIGRNPIIVVRDANQNIRAFHNVCRHRGSKLCHADKGKTAKLVCGYHQWTYELDGRLLFAGQEMGEGFNLEEFPLKEIHLKTAGGYIYICLSDNPPYIDDYLRDLAIYLEPYDLDNAKVAVETTIHEKANWKLVIENNRECYHCSGSHPELLNSLLEWDDSNDPRASPEFKAQLEEKANKWDAMNIPHRHVSHGNNRNRMVRMPLREGTIAMTIDGSRGCERTMGSITDPDLGSLRILHLPNSWSHAQGDHLIAFRVIPVGPEETLVTTKWLVHKDAVEGVDYQPEELCKVWQATNDQDRVLAERNQEGVNSVAYQPGPYSPTYEFGIVNFLTWYSDTVLRNSKEPE